VYGRLGSDAAGVLAALVASVADAIYAVDHEGRVQYVNPAGLRLLGYDDESELLGRPSHATIHHHRPDGAAYPEEACPLLAPRQTGETVRVESDWFIRRDGAFVPVAYSSAPVTTDEGRGAVVVFHDTTERRRAEEALAVHASRARIVQATLDERRRLGRDLHDGAQQRLVNVALALQLALRAQPPAATRELLEQALDETQHAVEDLRDLAAGLLPSVLIHRGLRGALETLAARAPVPVSLTVTEARYELVVEATAYFLVAEALTNVAKHADASEATVTIGERAGRLVVEVADDGRGGATPALGSGIEGLRDRVSALDGTLSVESPPRGGTMLRAELPLTSPEAA
jgi:PAS domain S-box-containing protein